MKLLILSRYDRLGASSRLRMMQYLPAFSDAGIETRVQPFFDDAYLEALYQGRHLGLGNIAYYWRRIRTPMRADAIWIEKELLPWLPWALERFALPSGVPMISDYDDAVFHRYDLHARLPVRWLLGKKIDRVMAASALVTAGNSYLADRARDAGAPWTEIVPTVVDATAYDPTPLPEVDGKPRIGWIGSPSTWAEYMLPMLPMLLDVAGAHSALVRNVGGGLGTSHPRLENLPWSEADESRMIQGMDIGLMPLDDSPWSQGKCGYKIIQYMACGLPVVASRVGVNSEIVEDGVTGFLATTQEEWHQAIARLMSDSDLRHRMGAAGRQRMERKYSLQVWGPKLAGLIRGVIER